VTALLPVRADLTAAAPAALAPLDHTRESPLTPALRVGSPVWRRVVAVGDALSAAVVLGILERVSPAFDAERIVIVVAVWLTFLVAAGAYDVNRVPFWPDEVRRVCCAAVGLAAALPLVAVATGGQPVHAVNVTFAAVAVGSAAVGQRWLLRAVSALRTGSRVGALRVVVAGHRRDVAKIVSELETARPRVYDVVAVCNTSPSVPGGEAQVADTVRANAADALVVAPCRHLDSAALRRLSWHLEKSRARLLVTTSLLDVSPGRARIAHVGGLPLVSVRSARIQGGLRVVKELTERLLALAALVLLSPLLVALAVLIRLDSPGPAIFRQTRAGKQGVPFSMLKFRTMRQDAEALRAELEHLSSPDGVLFKLRNDPRITRVGGLLRRYSLDELPQLINVVRGQMALVGPRPPLLEEVAQYEYDVRRRLAVKPGITGLWQVSGRSDLTWEESVRLDLRYVDNWSLGRDLAIVARTVGAVLGHRGAY
jgi:exopolysaccharide biosynthesis polyprenyl glycosylphosphotransferase